MCTLIVLHRRVPATPLVVAANRDEFYDRPAEAPALRPTARGAIAAPLDLRAGGTWLGVNRHGVFAALTNRTCPDPDPERRSRGRLVLDALDAVDAAEAIERIEKLEPNAYNPFNLVVADTRSIHAVTYRELPRRVELGAGVHVIGNCDLRAPAAPKTAALAREAERVASEAPEDLLEGLAALCRDHEDEEDPLGNICVHSGVYGTRSSILLRLAEDDEESCLLYADGPPCRTQYENFTPLLSELGLGAGSASENQAVRRAS